MRTLLLASLAIASLLPASGCLPIGRCGGFSGSQDRVYSRSSSEMLIVCENGGFVANLSAQSIEGRMEPTSDGTSNLEAIKGDDMSLAFDFISLSPDEVSTPQLGDGNWTRMNLDQTALDHADVMCTDLANRPWWSQQ